MVLQNWIIKLPKMQQTALLCGVRGLDGVGGEHPIKMLVRWYRRCVLLNSFTGQVLKTPHEEGDGSFTGACSPMIDFEETVLSMLKNRLEELPLHWVSHFAACSTLLAYKHSDVNKREFWLKVYNRIARTANLKVETEMAIDARTNDCEKTWEEGDK